MCSECDDIETTIARYRRLRHQVSDLQMHEAADRHIAGLEAKKFALHFEQSTQPDASVER
jgi:hypothetical protein